MGKRIFLLVVVPVLLAAACIKMKHEMTIQPVHITVDVRIKIDRELENFFSDIDKAVVKTETDDTQKKEELQ